jgi:hypothetical protein
MERLFASEEEAREHFGPDIDIEECECCRFFSASAADHEDGAIKGPFVNDDGTNEYDRICDECISEILMCEAEGI